MDKAAWLDHTQLFKGVIPHHVEGRWMVPYFPQSPSNVIHIREVHLGGSSSHPTPRILPLPRKLHNERFVGQPICIATRGEILVVQFNTMSHKRVSEGELWQKQRHALSSHLLKPQAVLQHTTTIDKVTSDCMSNLIKTRDSNDKVSNIQYLLFLWSLEASCAVIFGRRLGCLSENADPAIKDFIQDIQIILEATFNLMVVPPALAKRLGLQLWTNFDTAWNRVFEFGLNFINNVLEQQKNNGDNSIVSALGNSGLTKDDITAVLLELMIAAVDTTSSTVLWTLYLLSQNSETQERAYQEVMQRFPDGPYRLNQPHVNNLPFMRAVIRETLRLYPVAPVISRILDHDIVIRGYNIPAGVVINMMMCSMRHDENLYQNATQFIPERWLRTSSKKSIHPFASLPFGFGPRSCIGTTDCELKPQSMGNENCKEKRRKKIGRTPDEHSSGQDFTELQNSAC